MSRSLSGLRSTFRVSVPLLILSCVGCIYFAGATQDPRRTSVAAASKPSISKFVASAGKVKAGQSITLTAVFAHGKGVVSPGNLAIVSGQPLSVKPQSTTTYTLKVTNSAGAMATKTLQVDVMNAPPLVASFAASPATILPGESTLLTAVFTNGTGSISPGNEVVVSGKALSVSPLLTTAYTLTVTNSAGVEQTKQTTVTVNASTPPLLGVNVGWVNDWDPEQMFADAMKQARKFGSVESPANENANVDAQGWPLEDAGVLVIANNQGAWSAGQYALAFTGQASVAAIDDAHVSVSPVSYTTATNISTATVTVGPAYQNVYLVFTETQRTPSSPVGSGVTNVSLMRPSESGTPLPPGTLFTDVFLDRLKYFSAVRMMDYLEMNSSTEQTWTDRAIPGYASQQEVPPHASQNVSPQFVTGASYEYAIQLANQTGKDLWLNIPHLAFGGSYQFTSTDWATNLALLLQYGSDVNGNPYTGLAGSSGANPQPAAGPVNPGLNPGLHVYLEYSNEFWSGVGSQSAWIEGQANAAIAAGDPDLDWDHDRNEYDLVWRINAKGVMLIANAFASVYGAQAFGTVYRPIFAGQIANAGTFAGLAYLDSQHGGANQYVWAIAGAPYADFKGDTPKNTLTSAEVLSEMQAYETSNVTPWIGSLAALANTEQLEGGMVAYEGGQSTDFATAGAVAAQTAPGMRDVTTALIDSWFAQGGGTLFYYKLCSADTWGLAENIGYDIDADPGYSANPSTSTEKDPKWGAVKQVATLGH
ncbi:MAG: hypothetical protein ABSF53_18540 [Terracidiphilus sp.]